MTEKFPACALASALEMENASCVRGGWTVLITPHELTFLSSPPSLSTLAYTSGNIHESGKHMNLLEQWPIAAGEEGRFSESRGSAGREQCVCSRGGVLKTRKGPVRAWAGHANVEQTEVWV